MTTTTSSLLLSLHDIGVQLNRKEVLRNISFDIQRGEITTIIGPNGAGKSTLLKVITQLQRPSTGKLEVAKSLTYGYVPQKLSLVYSMPLKVSRFLSLARCSREEYKSALALLGITHLGARQMHNLSGGELQRVLLARAIARKPDVLVLDEPLQGVDVAGQVELYGMIAGLRETIGCAVVLVSHDLHLVMAQTDLVICLNQHMCCYGKPESVSQHPEYLNLFGEQAAKNIAVYTHKHDHHHDLAGEAVSCSDDCHHD
ncbi:MAG: zinc ABC transporter ATP-binding protein ZnuC [Alteromonadaceae bacterium]|nr:MAG: zinc ABC transporter ATP-binding protein ZnuC [Alteromonadaceae bacterium]